MVVLVRNIDNTCTLALKARLNELIDEGLIQSFLHEGEWIRIDRKLPRHEFAVPGKTDRGLTAMVSSF
jgi:hypothetical protein